jgi:hypothetical protein
LIDLVGGGGHGRQLIGLVGTGGRHGLIDPSCAGAMRDLGGDSMAAAWSAVAVGIAAD